MSTPTPSATTPSATTTNPGPPPQVVVVGSANLDLVVPVARAPQGGETILGGDLARHGGGKGANQAVAAARAGGAATAFIGAVGHDDAADFLLASLQEAGVQTEYVRTVDAATGMAFISVDPAGENAIVVAPGANSHVQITEAEADVISQASVILAQLEIPVETVVSAAQSRAPGSLFILNAAPSRPIPPELWDQIDILIVNEHEAADLAQSLNPDGAAEASTQELAAILLQQVPAVVVTLGSQGSLVATQPTAAAGSEPSYASVPAFPVESIDTTGAGDTFCGVLAASLAQPGPASHNSIAPDSLAHAALLASAAGALATTGHGAQTGVPHHRDVMTLATTAASDSATTS